MNKPRLTENERMVIAARFNSGLYSLDEIAHTFQRHRTTIVRVLEEQGIDPGIKRRTRKSAAVTDSSGRPIRIEMVEPKRWYQRALNAMLRVGQSLGIA